MMIHFRIFPVTSIIFIAYLYHIICVLPNKCIILLIETRINYIFWFIFCVNIDKTLKSSFSFKRKRELFHQSYARVFFLIERELRAKRHFYFFLFWENGSSLCNRKCEKGIFSKLCNRWILDRLKGDQTEYVINARFFFNKKYERFFIGL
jgi:hypothetical protein